METKATNKTKIISAVISVVAFFVVYYIIQFFFIGNKSSFQNEMEKASQEINKMCPQMIDSETRLDNSTVFPNKVMQYNYTLINMNSGEIDLEEMEQYLKESILNNVKTNPDLKIYRDNDATLNYLYKDKRGVFLLKIEIPPSLYK